MDRSATSYLLLHYAVLIGVILFLIEAIEMILPILPFWLGVLIALFIGLIYPIITVSLGIAPEQWERE